MIPILICGIRGVLGFMGVPRKTRNSLQQHMGALSVTFMRILTMSVVALILGTSSLAQGETAIFKYDGKTYAPRDLSPSLRQVHYEIQMDHYERLDALMDAAILEKHLKEKARKEGKTKDEVEESLLATKEPTEKEIKEWYEANKNRLPPGYAFEQIKGEIVKLLHGEAEKKKRDELISKLKGSGKADLLVARPQPPTIDLITKGFPSKGNDKAKVVLVEFADFQCPHCKAASGVLKSLMDRYGESVKLIYLDYPINRSGISEVVAHGGVCADEQGKYWPYHEMAFENQKSLTKESPEKFATALKLDEDRFKKCMASKRPEKKVARAKAEGDRVGISGTPTIFINGQKVRGYSEDVLETQIKRALEASS